MEKRVRISFVSKYKFCQGVVFDLVLLSYFIFKQGSGSSAL